MKDSTRHIKGGIWYNPNDPQDKERAERELEIVAENYCLDSVGLDILTQYADAKTKAVCFSNGDIWEVLPVSKAGCGRRFNISYISKKITNSGDIQIIKNSTTNLPYTGYKCY